MKSPCYVVTYTAFQCHMTHSSHGEKSLMDNLENCIENTSDFCLIKQYTDLKNFRDDTGILTL